MALKATSIDLHINMTALIRVLPPQEPLEYELLSSFCCWCMSAGSAEVRVRLPVSGYCPGQVMPMEVNCKNPSSVDIDKIKFAIKKVGNLITFSLSLR